MMHYLKSLKVYINTFLPNKTTFKIFLFQILGGKIQVNLSYPSNVVHVSGSQLYYIESHQSIKYLGFIMMGVGGRSFFFFFHKKIYILIAVLCFSQTLTFKDIKYWNELCSSSFNTQISENEWCYHILQLHLNTFKDFL